MTKNEVLSDVTVSNILTNGVPSFVEYHNSILLDRINDVLMEGISAALGNDFDPNEIVIENETGAAICQHVRYKGEYVGTLTAKECLGPQYKWNISFIYSKNT